MSNFGVDYNQLENKIYKKSYKLSDVKDKIVKVAFDIVRFKENDSATKLWQIQSSDDGEYIVALYDTSEDMVTTASTASHNPWKVEYNKIGKTINFYYKNYPIIQVASSKLGIKDTDLDSVENYLPERLSQNKKLACALLNQLDNRSKDHVFNKYPELKGA